MNTETKIHAFDYLVNGIKSWYLEAGGNLVQNDLSKLKITKLLFFICASTTGRTEKGLLNIFTNFVAMPYGHVEGDIQDHMNESEFFVISKDGLIDKPGAGHYIIRPDILEFQTLLEEGLHNLRDINFELINYEPFKLVDLSHRWQSWRTVFSVARSNGKNSMKIPDEMIMVEQKIFSIPS